MQPTPSNTQANLKSYLGLDDNKTIKYFRDSMIYLSATAVAIIPRMMSYRFSHPVIQLYSLIGSINLVSRIENLPPEKVLFTNNDKINPLLKYCMLMLPYITVTLNTKMFRPLVPKIIQRMNIPSLLGQIALVLYYGKYYNDCKILDSRDLLPPNAFVYADEKSPKSISLNNENNMKDKFGKDPKDFDDKRYLLIVNENEGECITPGMFDYISRFPNLKHLSVMCHHADFISFRNAPISKIEEFTLGCHAQNINLALNTGYLQNAYKNLETVTIHSDTLDKQGIQGISQITNLKEFNWSHYANPQDDSLTPLSQHHTLKTVRHGAFRHTGGAVLLQELQEARKKTGMLPLNTETMKS